MESASPRSPATITGSLSDATRTQVALERAAIRLVGRPDVIAAVTAQAERWREGTPGFLRETYAELRPSIDEVVFLVALQVVNGDPRRPQVVEISAGPHEWGGLAVPGGRWGINNPDTTYFAAPIESGSRYVVRGRRYGGAPTDINISVQTPDVWGTLDSLGREDIGYDADGGFAITVGDDDLPIRDGGTVLLIRQTLADWTAELPYELSIERTHGPDATAPASPDDLAARLIERLGVVIDHSLQTLQPPIFRLPVNTIPQPGHAGDKPGYLVAQRNTLGHFRLADDEALVLVVSPGGAGYAAVAAPNVWGVTADSARHVNSLNNHQATSDADGRFTAIVANADPGVANWIDPGGLREFILMLRWQLLADDPHATDEPGVTVSKIHASEVPSTVARTTQRQDQLAARAAAYARRFDAR